MSRISQEVKGYTMQRIMRIAIVGVPWYKREDYQRLLRIFSDRDNFATTYDEWLKAAESVMNNLRRNGHACQKVYIDPDTFPAWCAVNTIDIDAKARTLFASDFVARKHRKP